jgi:hypothetical protein
MPRKVFTAGEVLAAADVNEFLMDQAVQSFAGTAARGSAIPTAVEGMAAYLNDSNTLSFYDGSAWKTSLSTTGGILQVVSTAKTDIFSTTSATFVEVTGLSATITPKSTSSKILVLAQVSMGGADGAGAGAFKITKGGTDIYLGDESSSRTRAVGGSYSYSNTSLSIVSNSANFLDSPSTTSAVTYRVEVAITADSTVRVNFGSADSGVNSPAATRGASSITLLEVAG